jgi:hypothetical protein
LVKIYIKPHLPRFDLRALGNCPFEIQNIVSLRFFYTAPRIQIYRRFKNAPPRRPGRLFENRNASQNNAPVIAASHAFQNRLPLVTGRD